MLGAARVNEWKTTALHCSRMPTAVRLTEIKSINWSHSPCLPCCWMSECYERVVKRKQWNQWMRTVRNECNEWVNCTKWNMNGMRIMKWPLNEWIEETMNERESGANELKWVVTRMKGNGKRGGTEWPGRKAVLQLYWIKGNSLNVHSISVNFTEMNWTELSWINIITV